MKLLRIAMYVLEALAVAVSLIAVIGSRLLK